jgi:hypothetical protein
MVARMHLNVTLYVQYLCCWNLTVDAVLIV